LDLILGIFHTNKDFSIRFLIYIYINRMGKAFLYEVPQKQYLLVMTILPVCLLESLHNYVCLTQSSEFVIKIRYFLYRALLPIEMIGEMMCVLKVDNNSLYVKFCMMFYLIMFCAIEVYDNYTVSDRLYKDHINIELKRQKHEEALYDKKEQ
jgi:hypothetical protein